MFYKIADLEFLRRRHDFVSLVSYDETLSILKENERRRESIQDTLILCINSSSPLLASKDERKCLLALEIVEVCNHLSFVYD
jgi:hypothetical protein